MSETRDSRKKIGIALTQMFDNGDVRVFMEGYEIALVDHETGDSLVGIFRGVNADEDGSNPRILINPNTDRDSTVSMSLENIREIHLIRRIDDSPSTGKGIL